jgi:thymidylate synthase (FAD)
MLEQNLQNTPVAPPALQTIDPLNDGISAVQLIRISGSDVDVVNAARVSYGKFTDVLTPRDEKLIGFLMKHHHTSPFEHNQLSFRVKCPTFVMRQWIRHRMNSYNEISYRYVKAPLEFYVPSEWRYQDTQNRQGSVGSFEDQALKEQYLQALEVAKNTYEHLLEKGVAREIARGLLPVCTYTEFIFTCNLHSLINFLKLRLDAGAQWEIRVFAQALLKLALPHFPVSLGHWKRIYMPDLKLD